MKTLLTAAALIALTAAASSANAAVTITNTPGDTTPLGYTLVATFDAPLAAGYSMPGADIRSTSSGDAARPPGDATKFLAVTGGHSVTLSSLLGFTAFSFYMGSPDSYNWLQIDGGPKIYGTALYGTPSHAADGDQSVGFTVNYNLGGATAHSITFGSDSNSFELDNIATKGAVPEPASWAMMIAGFGLAGATLRQRRRAFA